MLLSSFSVIVIISPYSSSSASNSWFSTSRLLIRGMSSAVEETPNASASVQSRAYFGVLEPFYPFEEQVCIVCNEESKINGMRPNRSVKNDEGVMVDFIFGPAFICDCRGENLDSLSDEQIDRYGRMFRYPEHLARVNGTLFGIPYRPQPEQER